MKIKSKVILFAMLLTLIAPSLLQSSIIVSANTQTELVVTDEIKQEDIDLLAAELEFYFKEIGKINQNGEYQIVNPQVLRSKALGGDETAKDLYGSYVERVYTRSASDFGMCIVKEYFSPFIDIVNGRSWSAFVGYLKAEAWDQAAILLLKVAGKSTTKANIVSLAGQIAWAAYKCRSKW